MENSVKDLRKEQGWSQQDLAERLGVSRQSIISIERGRFDPSLELGIKIARAFGAPVESVFTIDDA
ncbi:helix-turn-helix transcriptional regulator [Fretibacter rubidus]|uniref:helix-turn-helix transcriptional regulator n=1 Tax=Fretibacter rubidus TaxID=570162 RepID=UPI00352A8D2D